MVLGDDLLLLDKEVADQYQETMRFLAVDINLSKSLVSFTGFGEFAKRFISGTDILSGISLAELQALHEAPANILELFRGRNLPLSSLLRTLGFGSISSGNIPSFKQGRSSTYKPSMSLLGLLPGITSNSCVNYDS